MTCKQCLKFNDCKDENSLTDYYREKIACDDVETRCKDYMDYDNFRKIYCRLCGTQRCPADNEAMQSCIHWKEVNDLVERN